MDYQKLNNVTKKDSYPLPWVDDMLDRMWGMEYYSSPNLASGYWQVESVEGNKQKTVFITFIGLFEFNVILLGQMATFQS